jgi:hypothetical protein
MSDSPNSTRKGKGTNWGLMALMNGAVAAWLIYDMATAAEEPSRAVAIMQYVFLAGTLIGLAGSLVKLLTRE